MPFPFAELTATQARPAVVMSGREFFRAEGKLILAAITSNVKAHAGPMNVNLMGWRECGLMKPSVVTSWLATLTPGLILMRIGTLPKEHLRAVESCLRATLAL